MAHILYSASHLFDGKKMAIKAVIALEQWYQKGGKGKRTTLMISFYNLPPLQQSLSFLFSITSLSEGGLWCVPIFLVEWHACLLWHLSVVLKSSHFWPYCWLRIQEVYCAVKWRGCACQFGKHFSVGAKENWEMPRGIAWNRSREEAQDK